MFANPAEFFNSLLDRLHLQISQFERLGIENLAKPANTRFVREDLLTIP